MSSEEIFLRQLDFFNPIDFEGKVTIVGVGAIGSSLALMLTKLGVRRFEIIDDDMVEDHNLPNQLYFVEDLEVPKVTAAKNMMERFSPSRNDFEISPRFSRATREFRTDSEVIIMAMDSRESRMELWEGIKKCPSVNMLIDARMGGETMRVYTVFPSSPESVKMYEKSFDGVPGNIPCTGQSIIYNLFSIAGFVGSNFAKYVRKENPDSRIVFDARNFILVKSSPFPFFDTEN